MGRRAEPGEIRNWASAETPANPSGAMQNQAPGEWTPAPDAQPAAPPEPPAVAERSTATRRVGGRQVTVLRQPGNRQNSKRESAFVTVDQTDYLVVRSLEIGGARRAAGQQFNLYSRPHAEHPPSPSDEMGPDSLVTAGWSRLGRLQGQNFNPASGVWADRRAEQTAIARDGATAIRREYTERTRVRATRESYEAANRERLRAEELARREAEQAARRAAAQAQLASSQGSTNQLVQQAPHRMAYGGGLPQVSEATPCIRQAVYENNEVSDRRRVARAYLDENGDEFYAVFRVSDGSITMNSFRAGSTQYNSLRLAEAALRPGSGQLVDIGPLPGSEDRVRRQRERDAEEARRAEARRAAQEEADRQARESRREREEREARERAEIEAAHPELATQREAVKEAERLAKETRELLNDPQRVGELIREGNPANDSVLQSWLAARKDADIAQRKRQKARGPLEWAQASVKVDGVPSDQMTPDALRRFQDRMHDIFPSVPKEQITPYAIAALTGMEGAEVTINSHAGTAHADFYHVSPTGRRDRWAYCDRNLSTNDFYNSLFFDDRANVDSGRTTDPPPGFGTMIFARQVRALATIGLERIRVTAGGSRESSMNGFYTWPLLGYNTSIDGDLARRTGARDLNELMRTAEGRGIWYLEGGQRSMTFDLKPGSKSMQALESYLAETDSKALAALQGAGPGQRVSKPVGSRTIERLQAAKYNRRIRAAAKLKKTYEAALQAAQDAQAEARRSRGTSR